MSQSAPRFLSVSTHPISDAIRVEHGLADGRRSKFIPEVRPPDLTFPNLEQADRDLRSE